MSDRSDQPAADRFWQWTLAFYGGPGVSEAFVALQDEHGADVNVMLALLWLAAEGQAALEAEAIERLDMAVADWRAEIVEPLRRLRRALKGRGEEDVRRPLATAELEAERSAQRRIVAALPPGRPGEGSAPDRAAASLRRYRAGFPPRLVSVLVGRLAG